MRSSNKGFIVGDLVTIDRVPGTFRVDSLARNDNSEIFTVIPLPVPEGYHKPVSIGVCAAYCTLVIDDSGDPE